MLYHIINANIVMPDELLEDACLSIEDGFISSICGNTSGGTVIDAAGSYLLPGLIDIHSDNIEQVVEPRTGTLMDVSLALQEQEKQLINQGITTIYHSLSMSRMGTKAARGEMFPKVIQEISDLGNHPRLIRHRLHIRFDITFIEAVPNLISLLDDAPVSLLSFTDHTPGQGQFRDLERFKNNTRLNNPSLSEEKIDERFKKRMEAERVSGDKLAAIACYAKSKGLSIASHDDDSVEKVDFMKNMLHATISEFPVEIEVARYAKTKGMATLGGAPNVLLGKSHTGNLSAVQGILDNSITMLCSDYYPPSMLQAVFKLHREFDLRKVGYACAG